MSKQFQQKSNKVSHFLITVFLPITFITIFHFTVYSLCGIFERYEYTWSHGLYQFSVWMPIDNKISYAVEAWKIFFTYYGQYIYDSHALIFVVMPIIIYFFCGRRTFMFLIKTQFIAIIVSALIFIIFPIYDFKYGEFWGNDNLAGRDCSTWFKDGDYTKIPWDYSIETENVTPCPSFHCLAALMPMLALYFCFKIEFKRPNKKFYIPAIFLSTLFFVSTYLATITNPWPHFIADGWISLLIALFACFSFFFILKKKESWIEIKTVDKISCTLGTTKNIHLKRFINFISVFSLFLLAAFVIVSTAQCVFISTGQTFI